jgi:hypothetical protein
LVKCLYQMTVKKVSRLLLKKESRILKVNKLT